MDADMAEIKACLKEIKNEIVSVKIGMATPRGVSWGVASVLMGLTSLSLSFIVFYFTRYVIR